MRDQRRNSEITVKPLGYALGAEVLGVDTSAPPALDTVNAVSALWYEHHVIAFRGERLEPQDITAFAGAFGTLDDHASTPFYRHQDFPELLQVTNREIDGKPS